MLLDVAVDVAHLDVLRRLFHFQYPVIDVLIMKLGTRLIVLCKDLHLCPVVLLVILFDALPELEQDAVKGRRVQCIVLRLVHLVDEEDGDDPLTLVQHLAVSSLHARPRSGTKRNQP